MLPEKVRIGGCWWVVEQVENSLKDQGKDGLCIPDRCVLQVAAEQTDYQKLVTLLHEIIHACCRFSGMDMDKRYSEEGFATRLSPILFAVLAENPELQTAIELYRGQMEFECRR